MTTRSDITHGTRMMTSMLLAAIILQSLTGCSRRFWREQAQQDSYRAISEKLTDERWLLPRIDTNPDSRSRFYDPYDPDCEPLPPDDAAAHAFMHCADGHEGYKCWHELGDTISVENPQWLEPYTVLTQGSPVDSHHEVEIPRVNLQDSLELTYIHSREFQSQIEDVYLTALELTEQRYLLKTRFRLGDGGGPGGVFLASPLWTGPRTGPLSHETGIGFSQLLPSGGTFVLDVINSVTWGGGGFSATGLAWSLSQPLLAGAGRKVVLENLTQSERNLLYDVRNMARFRQTIFTAVAQDYLELQLQSQNIINRQNNIRQLEEQIEVGQVEDGWNPGVVREPLKQFPENAEIPESLRLKLKHDGEYLIWEGPLEEDEKAALLAISDDRFFQSAVQQLIRWRETQVLSLGVSQLVTRLNSAQNTLEGSRRQLADQLDAFKIRIGLPPNVAMTVDDTFLRPFELIDDRLLGVADELKDFAKAEGPALIPAPRGVRTSERLPPEYADLRKYVASLLKLENRIRTIGLEQVEQDFVPVRDILEATSKDFSAPVNGRNFLTKEERDRVIRDVARDLRLYRLNERDFEGFSRELKQLNELLKAETEEQLISSLDSNGDQRISLEELPIGWSELPSVGNVKVEEKLTSSEFIGLIRDAAVQIREELLQITQSLQVVQAGLRVEAIALNPFEIEGYEGKPDIEQVVNIGLVNRHDLMNARAAVMDSRRKVEVAANALKAKLDLKVGGTVDLEGGGGRRTANNVSLDFKTPIDHVQQRNDYNVALIDYQRARRTYMSLEDQVKQQIRGSWRQLMVNEQKLEIDRQTVRNSALQYDNVATGVGQNNNLSLLNALDDLLNAQNTLVQDWITYETNRLNIFRDMGIMQINSEGIWVDPFYLGDGPSVTDTLTDAAVLVPATPQQVLPQQPTPDGPPALEISEQ